MILTVRQLTAENAEAAWQLGYEAFGGPSPRPAETATVDLPGRTWFGAFADDVLVGQMIDRDRGLRHRRAADRDAGCGAAAGWGPYAAGHRGRLRGHPGCL